jgi:DMSO/TMAO reductase YedYZ molybdopterin-dependent catalytic subunit
MTSLLRARARDAVPQPRPPWLPAAFVGVAAGVLGLGVAEVVAGVVSPSSAPLVALGDAFVDRVPPGLKDTAISLFGTRDKQVLLAGALLVALLLSALAGVLSRNRGRAGMWVVLALGALAAWAAVTRPDATLLSALPSVLGAIAGMVALQRVSGTLDPVPIFRPGDEPLEPLVPVDPADAPALPPSRRALLGAGWLLLGGVVGAVAGRLLGTRLRDADASRTAVEDRLPATARTPDPLPPGAEVGVRGVVPFRVPNEDFYRIDTALLVPRLNAEEWRLRIHGLVGQEVTLTFDDLLQQRAGALVERDITLACVSNEVGGDLVGNARWLGLPIAPLLARARPQPAADMVLSTSADGFTCGTPLAALTDGRDALLAIAMNGEPLPVEHGFPVRMVVPGLYGYVSATKWVVDLELTRFDRVQAYWTPRGWAEQAPVKTASRIDVPNDGAQVRAGRVAVAGVAWAQRRGIRAVEVQVDDGAWQPARLAADVSVDTWRQWVLDWDAPAGRHRLRVRATDGTGAVQTGADAPPAPDGATGWHTIEVDVD